MNMIAKKDQQVAPVAESETAAILSIVARAAADPAVDIDKLERLMQMQERALARQSEQAFNDAMNRAQSHMGRVATNKLNSQTKSRYADYAALDKVLRPIYTGEGFNLSFSTEPGAPEGEIRVVCHVSHSGGHTRKYQVDMPADGKGAKGGDVMTKTHAVGAGMSYGMRYLLKMIFNVAIGEDDNDGNDPSAAAKAGDFAEAMEGADTVLALEKIGKELATSKLPDALKKGLRARYSERLAQIKGGQ